MGQGCGTGTGQGMWQIWGGQWIGGCGHIMDGCGGGHCSGGGQNDGWHIDIGPPGPHCIPYYLIFIKLFKINKQNLKIFYYLDSF